MTGVSQSTATRQMNPKLAALVLAALRLKVKLELPPTLPLEGRKS